MSIKKFINRFFAGMTLFALSGDLARAGRSFGFGMRAPAVIPVRYPGDGGLPASNGSKLRPRGGHARGCNWN